jgi:hypothetical protein
MSFHLKLRLVRLERAEAKAAGYRPFKFRYGHLKRLPPDYSGERHVAIAQTLRPDSTGKEWFEFEERPGPAPPEPPSAERIMNILHVAPEEGR